jgi:hypothetical protein
MKFLFELGDDVEVATAGRIIERTETEFGNRYFVQLDSGRKIGLREDELVSVTENGMMEVEND